ncbi:MAG: hypothetical protein CVV27_20385 [Candidatus Melainabacteria bacterium HGW-Melainabacteria-1]|nr:MAG: hypothetical protein CVV27_20385 [Candidatus Melainabacteria bacterium HGW-Melainabacteria-1]
MADRKIERIIKSRPVIEGAGVHLNRVFGFGETGLFDPFLLLDDFRSDVPEHYLKGFPWHPHRGIETITYMLRGTVEHGDSLGNSGVIMPGDVQWMTAGGGIIHQEMPKGGDEGSMHGFQLWANLPGSHKMMEPRYREVKSTDIPVVESDDGVVMKIICGNAGTVKGPVSDVVIDPEYIDVTVPAGMKFRHPTKRGHTVLTYVIEGEGSFAGAEEPFSYDEVGRNYFDYSKQPMIGNGTLIVFADGDAIEVSASGKGVRFLLIAGRPIGEPVAWHGPIVMNTREELRQAFEELDAGTFIRHG